MASMTNEQVLESIRAGLGAKVLNTEETYGMLSIEIAREDVLEVIGWLKDSDTLRMRFLTDLCAVHFPENKDKELGVVYHLHSLENNIRLRVKTFFPESDPHVASLTPLFAGANWMERETYDFYGVQFTGHPDLRRILNVDSMDYFPMRKQYALEDETRTDKQDKYFGR